MRYPEPSLVRSGCRTAVAGYENAAEAQNPCGVLFFYVAVAASRRHGRRLALHRARRARRRNLRLRPPPSARQRPTMTAERARENEQITVRHAGAPLRFEIHDIVHVPRVQRAERADPRLAALRQRALGQSALSSLAANVRGNHGDETTIDRGLTGPVRSRPDRRFSPVFVMTN